MKTTIKKEVTIVLSDAEFGTLKEILVNLDPYPTDKNTFLFGAKECKKLINILIDINPTKEKHKDFIMELIKELKR